jgi:hypothetical protein
MAGSETVVSSVELRCPNCGAPWTMRGFKTTRTLCCESCGSVIDTSGEAWQLVEKVEKAHKLKPRYALGTRGELDGVAWEVIGWQSRSVRSYGTTYRWEEHLLYNPYHGFRYLLFQDGHWVIVTPCPGVPNTGVNHAQYMTRTYKHFSTADAKVDEVLGEFPWQARRGDTATATDYVAPPRILSSEESAGEVVWSEGRYLQRAEVVKAFGEPTRKAKAPRGIHPCQPNPDTALVKWLAAALVVGLLAWLFTVVVYLGGREHRQIHSAQVGPSEWKAGFSQELEVQSDHAPATLEIAGHAGVDNSWVWLPIMLVGPLDKGEEARTLELEISYYHGYSGGESWSEGSQTNELLIGGVENGRYVLQVDPAKTDARRPYSGPLALSVTQDVRLYRYPCCSLLLLLALPIGVFVKSRLFEQRRWQESDHA